MKIKLVVLEMEADGTGATDSLCTSLGEFLAAVFPPVERETASENSVGEGEIGDE